jgi:hypothetical protein
LPSSFLNTYRLAVDFQISNEFVLYQIKNFLTASKPPYIKIFI